MPRAEELIDGLLAGTLGSPDVPADYVSVFHLDNPEARQEPNAHYAVPVSTERRAAYAQRWDEVKAA